MKQYVLNRETGKIELQFDKSEYQALTADQKSILKRFFLWSPKRQAWVSRGTKDHYFAIRTAQQLGFTDGGQVGERLSFAEKVAREAKKAEQRAQRYERYAENAERRAEHLQREMNEMFENQDIAFFTQPIMRGHAGSERFARQRQRIYERYYKGFEEYRKSEYFREKAMTAMRTANMEKYRNRAYLNNRIEECKKEIRDIERRIVRAEEIGNEEWLQQLLEKMEEQIDKLAFLQNCLDEIGGIEYSKENVKPGYFALIHNNWCEVVKANNKTIEVKSPFGNYTLKYTYAEINDIKIPDDWKETKQEAVNPFNVNDIVVQRSVGGDKIIKAFQIVKKTDKSVTLKEIEIQDNKPVSNAFVNDKQERRAVKKTITGDYIVNYDNWPLYKYVN